LSNKVTASTCFVDVDNALLLLLLLLLLLVEGDVIRIVFVVRIGLLSFDDGSRLKYELDNGDKLVPVEFGGVRCLLVPSSVFKKKQNNRMKNKNFEDIYELSS